MDRLRLGARSFAALRTLPEIAAKPADTFAGTGHRSRQLGAEDLGRADRGGRSVRSGSAVGLGCRRRASDGRIRAAPRGSWAVMA